MAEEYSRKAVFEILGQEVPDKEMQRAESYADRKLERATEMQPEDAATYRSGWYRVLLVADLVKQLAFQDFTLALCELRNYPNIDTFETLFRKTEASSFMKGENDRNWRADFDWIMKPTNMCKVLEGKYDDKKKAAELHMVAYATYQLSLRIDELNNSKTKKEDPENEENKRTE